MNPYLIIAALVAVLAAGAGGFKLGADHQVAAQAREQNHIAEAVDAANAVSAEAISKIKVTNKTIQNEVRREVETNTVYADCKLTPVGLQLANQALAGTKPADSGKLPGKATAPTE
jgi:hypothetical protein